MSSLGPYFRKSCHCPVRSVESLEARWKVIKYENLKFIGFVQVAKGRSGCNGADGINAAVNYSVRAQQQLENQERSFSSCIAMSISKNARSSALDIYKKRSQQLSEMVADEAEANETSKGQAN
ncbi:hypothetical protein O0I10_002362 [Lichtheimia ornata]|uniref:Uncharacterized protein n=1 Tax=Lichtheimia ornata TaxID=688661 RepID=A0AAD7Y0X5_9FUNG|nr:uncharacterized protein O0I10_002362 [Lichtheimia ornata]KAJ8662030.1 hypothetical protein O0I10_002362 [Lichtheimia ornata]